MDKTTKSTRKFYAISYHCGRNMISAETGDKVGTIYVFPTRVDRDRYVADSPTAYFTESGYRETLPTSDRTLRRLLRRVERGEDVIDDLYAGGYYTREEYEAQLSGWK